MGYARAGSNPAFGTSFQSQKSTHLATVGRKIFAPASWFSRGLPRALGPDLPCRSRVFARIFAKSLQDNCKLKSIPCWFSESCRDCAEDEQGRVGDSQKATYRVAPTASRYRMKIIQLPFPLSAYERWSMEFDIMTLTIKNVSDSATGTPCRLGRCCCLCAASERRWPVRV